MVRGWFGGGSGVVRGGSGVVRGWFGGGSGVVRLWRLNRRQQFFVEVAAWAVF